MFGFDPAFFGSLIQVIFIDLRSEERRVGKVC